MRINGDRGRGRQACLLGENINNAVERYKLANELSQVTNDDDSAINLTRRVVALLGMDKEIGRPKT